MTEPAATLTGQRVSSRALGRLLDPRSVVVIGASDDPASIGGAPLALLERFGYRGDVHLVSRTRREVNGKACVASVQELPEGVDVAILAVPRSATLGLLEELGQRSVGGAVVFSSGWAETGTAGAAEERALRAVALRHDIALAGPNCLGLVNFAEAAPLTFGDLSPNRRTSGGGVAVVAQSGAMSLALTYAAMAQGTTVTHMVSTGNEAVLGTEDYLAALVSGRATRVVALLVEQVRRPAEFLAVARDAREKGVAICLLHVGRSERSRAASLSHTGAVAGDQQVLRAVLSREGVVFIDSLDELVDAAGVLAAGKLPGGEGVGLMTDSGALKSFAIDFASSIGVCLPSMKEATLQGLARELPEFATPSNPLDITAMGLNDPSLYGRAASALLADDEVATLVVASMPGSEVQNSQQMGALLPVLRGAGKPVVYTIMGGELPLPEANREQIIEAGVPLFRSPERAMKAVRNLVSYSQSVARCTARSAPCPGTALSLSSWVHAREHEAKAVLSELGVPTPRGQLVTELEQARTAARRTGYPVVLKICSPAVLHKSDVGGVAFAANEAELDERYETVRSRLALSRPDAPVEGVLVEEVVAGGTEMLVGCRRDSSWGPYTVVGFGGTLAEAIQDVAVVAGDADRAEIAAAVGSLRCAPVLAGARGRPPRDVSALLDTVEVIAAALRASPGVAEIEVNPLLVLDEGSGVVALDAMVLLHQERETALERKGS
jgi:acyl-CoA synthetase (NDP forming)